jgi:AcrR family transcriptional regulator
MREPGLRERKKEQTRRDLVRHGLRLFIEHGFEETSVEAIAAAANVAPRTFFRYFKTKEDLFSFDQDRQDQALRATLADRRPGEDDVTLLGRALQAVMSIEGEDLEMSANMTQVILGQPSLKAHVLEELMRTEQIIAEGLVPGKASRAEHLRARMLATAALSVYFRVMTTWVEGGRRGSVHELTRPCLDWLRSGFVPHRRAR